MSDASKTNWTRVDALTEADIDTSDIPPQGKEFFARAHWRLPPQNADRFPYPSPWNQPLHRPARDGKD